MAPLLFISRSLVYFRKQHLALFLATVISTAVLTGALIIGDSVRSSLEHLVDLRLGKTQFAIATGSRFVRAELANEIAAGLHVQAEPVFLVRGIAIRPDNDRRINNVQVLGVDQGFFAFADGKYSAPAPGEALLSENAARRLSLRKGDSFLLRVQKATLIPLNSPFSPETGSSISMRLTVAGVAGDSVLGRFSLQNNQAAPFNIFVNREDLASQMELPGLANLILLGKSPDGAGLADIHSVLSKCWRLQDASLRIDVLGESGLYDLTSTRVFLDSSVIAITQRLPFPHTEVLTYLVNTFTDGQKQTPYSFVTASAPPVLPSNPGADGIIINRWLADDLQARKGDTLRLDYFVIGPLRTLSTRSKPFVVTGIVPTDGSIPAKSLMPSFPGLSDAGSCRDWNAGIPIDLKRIRDKDEQYWNTYRGSPKAFISLQTGQQLWGNRFGNCTAIRFRESDIPADSLKKALLERYTPEMAGIDVVAVRQTGKAAAANSVDFGSLFLYLSFFVIVGSILLIILVYSLNTETRTRESAVLAGIGFSRKRIVRLRLLESAPVIIAGSLAGVAAGIAYNQLLLNGLNTLWQGAVRTHMLSMSLDPGTLAIGACSGMILALVSVGWVTLRKLKNPVSGLMRAAQTLQMESGKPGKSRSGIISLISLGISILLVGYSILTGAFQDATLFLSAGALFLISAISFFAWRLGKPSFDNDSQMSLGALSIRNAGRNRSRSLSVIIILALGVFSVVLTGAYRKTFYGSENSVKSGTGGYLLWVGTTLPLPFSLNTPEGKNRLIVNQPAELDSVHFLQLHSIEGDDASCLNLNQVQKPRILGVPAGSFDRRGAFSFVKLAKGIDPEHPWKALDESYGNHTYPAYADQTVIQYGLKKSLGDTLTYYNDQGQAVHFVLIGGLDNSVFQGNLLVSDKVITSQFPSAGGSRVMLVDAPSGRQQAVTRILEKSLPDYGVDVTSAPERLAEFNSVENTYLTVFMVLGGLGLLLGTFGLGLVLMRNMLERKHELAVLLAMGYKKNQLVKLVLYEYSFLLLAGVMSGALSACLGILPSLVSPVFTIQPGFLLMLILAIVAGGVLWIYSASRMMLKQNLVSSLKEEA